METLTALKRSYPSAAHLAKGCDLGGCCQSDAEFVRRLRLGDGATFATLVDEQTPTMLKIAGTFVRSRAVAEEVVQETWLAVLRGVHRFEGRSSLKTWIYRILVNVAKTQAGRERRSLPFSALTFAGQQPEAAVDPERFLPPNHDRWPGHWALPPGSWAAEPEDRLLTTESMGVVKEAIESLPDAQRAVITLRDVQGWTAEEVCTLLRVSQVNQRVLLHRARSRVRDRLERYLSSPTPAGA